MLLFDQVGSIIPDKASAVVLLFVKALYGFFIRFIGANDVHSSRLIVKSAKMALLYLSDYLTRIPGLAPSSGFNIHKSLPPGPAANTMPSLMPKRILRGARFATITVSLPSKSSG